ncbi:MAG TPA: hypothetical protein DCQ92_12380 [Verrucomicrobia subdivision 3 bacterium]|nr:hypothetical protein [Limisphaerales bacterium]
MDLEAIAKATLVKSLERGEYLFHEGDLATGYSSACLRASILPEPSGWRANEAPDKSSPPCFAIRAFDICRGFLIGNGLKNTI